MATAVADAVAWGVAPTPPGPPDPPRDPSLGQNFLVDGALARRAVRHAEVGRGDTVLEIGPGGGALTRALLERAGRVVAIEFDRRLEPALGALREESGGRLELLWGDALELPWPRVDKAVANLPYGTALPLVFRLLEVGVPLSLLMLQRSLAERLAADPGEPRYGGVTVRARRLSSARIVEVVGAHQFDPPPAVESALLRLARVPERFPLPPVAADGGPGASAGDGSAGEGDGGGAPGETWFRGLLDALFLHRERPLGRALEALGADRDALLRGLPRRVRDRLEGRPVAAISPNDFGRIAWSAAEAGWRPPPVSAADKRRAQRRGG